MSKMSARRASSLSKKRATLTLSEETIALGEKLVVELNLVESTDTLARWMAHYVAELMVRAEHAALPERDEAQGECARAILDLWAQARGFPVERTVFGSIDRVIEVINSLHPESGAYYRENLWRSLDASSKNGGSEVNGILAAALGIDDAARNLIHYFLAHAAKIAGRDNGEWLDLVERLDDPDPITELRIRIVREGQKELQLKNHRIEQLERRIAQLEYFENLTRELKAILVESLETAKSAS